MGTTSPTRSPAMANLAEALAASSKYAAYLYCSEALVEFIFGYDSSYDLVYA